MSGLTMQVFYLGHMYFERFRLIQTEDETAMIRSPAVAILIRHPKLGNILYDTGNASNFKDCYPPHVQEAYPVHEFISIEDALKAHGLTPGDIDLLVLSHLHFDHAGGLKYFCHTKAGKNILVNKEELIEALMSVYTVQETPHGAYVKSLFDLDGILFHPIEGALELAEDLILFPMQSHTPGVLGMLIKTEHQGNIICVSDTLYIADSYEKGLPPGGTINKTTTEFFDNLARIKEMQEKYNATILFGHDYDQVLAWSREIID